MGNAASTAAAAQLADTDVRMELRGDGACMGEKLEFTLKESETVPPSFTLRGISRQQLQAELVELNGVLRRVLPERSPPIKMVPLVFFICGFLTFILTALSAVGATTSGRTDDVPNLRPGQIAGVALFVIGVLATIGLTRWWQGKAQEAVEGVRAYLHETTNGKEPWKGARVVWTLDSFLETVGSGKDRRSVQVFYLLAKVPPMTPDMLAVAAGGMPGMGQPGMGMGMGQHAPLPQGFPQYQAGQGQQGMGVGYPPQQQSGMPQPQYGYGPGPGAGQYPPPYPPNYPYPAQYQQQAGGYYPSSGSSSQSAGYPPGPGAGYPGAYPPAAASGSDTGSSTQAHPAASAPSFSTGGPGSLGLAPPQPGVFPQAYPAVGGQGEGGYTAGYKGGL